MRIVGDPPDWVASGGRWAPVLDAWDGIPSYESEDGSLVVHELAVLHDADGMDETLVHVGGAGVRAAVPRMTSILPRGYGLVTARNMALDETSGLVPLHDEPGAAWMWRPLLYRILHDGRLQRFGSQNELAWRNGLMEAQRRSMARREVLAHAASRAFDGEFPPFEEWAATIRDLVERWEAATPWRFTAADARAREILLEHLSPQQRLDFEAARRFYVRGRLNEMYAIRPGDGVAIVDPATRETRVGLCVHPETWLPDDDVALAHKLLIESGEDGERALLDVARRYPNADWRPRPATRGERYARDAERWLEGEPA